MRYNFIKNLCLIIIIIIIMWKILKVDGETTMYLLLTYIRRRVTYH
jgi:hypothetical protein